MFTVQAYQVELELLAVKLEEENERLLKEKVLLLHTSNLNFFDIFAYFECDLRCSVNSFANPSWFNKIDLLQNFTTSSCLDPLQISSCSFNSEINSILVKDHHLQSKLILF